jgi:hypothetical protein
LADWPLADTIFQSTTPRRMMNIQKRIVLTVELLFTAYLTRDERKIVVCQAHAKPAPFRASAQYKTNSRHSHYFVPSRSLLDT